MLNPLRWLCLCVLVLIVSSCGGDDWRQQLDHDIYLLNIERKQKARLVETASEMKVYLAWSRAEMNKVLERYTNHEDPAVANRIALYQEIGNRQIDVATAVIDRLAALEDLAPRYQKALADPVEMQGLLADVRMFLQTVAGMAGAIDADRDAVRLMISSSDLSDEYKRELWSDAQGAFMNAKSEASGLTRHQPWLEAMARVLEYLIERQGQYQVTEQGLVFKYQGDADRYNTYVEWMQSARERMRD